MKPSRPLIATWLALVGGAGWAVWQTDAARSGPAAAPTSSPATSSAATQRSGARTSDDVVLAAHEASLGNDDDPPTDWTHAGPDLLTPPHRPHADATPALPENTLKGAPQILRPEPVKPEQRLPAVPSHPVPSDPVPSDPVPANPAEESLLPFSVVDVPGDQPAGPGPAPSPESADAAGPAVRRLPPLPPGLFAMPESAGPRDITYPTTAPAEQPPVSRQPADAAATPQMPAAPEASATAPAKDLGSAAAPPQAAAAPMAASSTDTPPTAAAPTPTEQPSPLGGPALAEGLGRPQSPPSQPPVSSPSPPAAAPITTAAVPVAPAPAAPVVASQSAPSITSTRPANAAPEATGVEEPENPFLKARGPSLPIPTSTEAGLAGDDKAGASPLNQPSAALAPPASTVAEGRTALPAWSSPRPSQPAVASQPTPANQPAAASDSASGSQPPAWAASPGSFAPSSTASMAATPTAPRTTPETQAGSALSLPSDAAARQAMNAVLWKAEGHFQRGVSLADRRAFYSARAEFLAALRLLAQGLDAREGSTARSEALARGVRAIDEADDFLPRGGGLNAEMPFARLVAAHRTPVLKSSAGKPTDATPLQALQQYYTYAQEQLAAAVRPSREGSQALTALGKLYTEMDLEPARLVIDGKTKGLVYQQAALLVDPNNARAANELGVLLAREGRNEEARDWLRHSLRVRPQQETWHNLASVHGSLGETQLAAAAQQQSVLLARRQGQTAGGAPVVQVKQVPPAEFARTSQPGPATTAATPNTRQPANTPKAAAKPKNSGLWDWLPWR